MAEYLRYMCKHMRITQNYNGTFSHYGNSHGSPKDYPIDEGGLDTGRSAIYAPCECKVVRMYGVGNRGTNTVWLQSTHKVHLANGKLDYVTIMCIHPNDDDLRNIKVGQVFKQGEKMFREGSDGLSSGNHVHLSVGTGKIQNTGWACNSKGQWVIRTTGNAIRPESAFYLDRDWNKVLSSNGLQFKSRSFKSTVNKTNTKVTYYKKCDKDCKTITQGLKDIGIVYSFSNRAKIAKLNNISNYVGSAQQNNKMLSLLKQGKLRRY